MIKDGRMNNIMKQKNHMLIQIKKIKIILIGRIKYNIKKYVYYINKFLF